MAVRGARPAPLSRRAAWRIPSAPAPLSSAHDQPARGHRRAWRTTIKGKTKRDFSDWIDTTFKALRAQACTQIGPQFQLVVAPVRANEAAWDAAAAPAMLPVVPVTMTMTAVVAEKAAAAAAARPSSKRRAALTGAPADDDSDEYVPPAAEARQRPGMRSAAAGGGSSGRSAQSRPAPQPEQPDVIVGSFLYTHDANMGDVLYHQTTDVTKNSLGAIVRCSSTSGPDIYHPLDIVKQRCAAYALDLEESAAEAAAESTAGRGAAAAPGPVGMYESGSDEGPDDRRERARRLATAPHVSPSPPAKALQPSPPAGRRSDANPSPARRVHVPEVGGKRAREASPRKRVARLRPAGAGFPRRATRPGPGLGPGPGPAPGRPTPRRPRSLSRRPSRGTRHRPTGPPRPRRPAAAAHGATGTGRWAGVAAQARRTAWEVPGQRVSERWRMAARRARGGRAYAHLVGKFDRTSARQGPSCASWGRGGPGAAGSARAGARAPGHRDGARQPRWTKPAAASGSAASRRPRRGFDPVRHPRGAVMG